MLPKWLKEFEKRQRAREELPGWVRSVLPTLVLGNALGTSFAIGWISAVVRQQLRPELGPLFVLPQGPADPHDVLLGFTCFIAGACTSILITNAVVYRIPPLRRVLEESAKEKGTPGYARAQSQARKALFYVGVPLATAVLLTAWSPWK
jgi:hypothetical protein